MGFDVLKNLKTAFSKDGNQLNAFADETAKYFIIGASGAKLIKPNETHFAAQHLAKHVKHTGFLYLTETSGAYQPLFKKMTVNSEYKGKLASPIANQDAFGVVLHELSHAVQCDHFFNHPAFPLDQGVHSIDEGLADISEFMILKQTLGGETAFASVNAMEAPKGDDIPYDQVQEYFSKLYHLDENLTGMTPTCYDRFFPAIIKLQKEFNVPLVDMVRSSTVFERDLGLSIKEQYETKFERRMGEYSFAALSPELKKSRVILGELPPISRRDCEVFIDELNCR
jgi:hypothetical protein